MVKCITFNDGGKGEGGGKENESKLWGIGCTRGQLPTNKGVRSRVCLKAADGNKTEGIYSQLFWLNIGRYTFVILVQTSRKYQVLGIIIV